MTFGIMRCRLFGHYKGVWTTNVGGFYYCVKCNEILGHYFISEEKRLDQ